MIWRPLLEGDLALRALQAVEDVALALESYTPADDLRFPSLSGGAAGEAVFHAYLALHNGDEHQAERAATLLERAAQFLATTLMPPGLYSGFSGVAWAGEHLQARLFEPDPEGDDPNREIDEALLDYLSTLTELDEYDLISGVTGLGVYARERLSYPSGAVLLERVVDRLATQAETGPEGTAWFTPPDRLPEWQREIHPKGLYNLGVAHGIPAVVALLAIACRGGIAADRARPLLDGTVRWLLARQLPAGQGSCFGTSFVAGEESGASRLAWCYGDPGIAATLLVAARAAGEPAWEDKALEVARAAARRSSLSSATPGFAMAPPASPISSTVSGRRAARRSSATLRALGSNAPWSSASPARGSPAFAPGTRCRRARTANGRPSPACSKEPQASRSSCWQPSRRSSRSGTGSSSCLDSRKALP